MGPEPNSPRPKVLRVIKAFKSPDNCRTVVVLINWNKMQTSVAASESHFKVNKLHNVVYT